ncbi:MULTISPECIES: hypothetical protein [Photorhabdus]|uniref:Leucine rich repeat variant n=1 Tax=Photorhabdus thracensis TaxID=230089 RepID=A0A0F7LP84_9GAMM|nr:hypothetical protein [Photorhabdus thracensis]AKH62501.1 hypothetical protein VY86_03235 [Photorhabdus thracensis]AKH63893.1 hypothetical protein VY86_11720 [Photorhabdus thracensis]
MIHTIEEFVRLRNSNIPAEYMRAGVDEAPLLIWKELIEKKPDMRVWVARNKTIPKEIIVALSKDDNPIVRDAIAAKYPLDMDIYLSLSKDPDEGIRARLTYNKGLPISILKEMSESDPSDFVKSQAIDRYQQRIT